jgi:hypothetical protein
MPRLSRFTTLAVALVIGAAACTGDTPTSPAAPPAASPVSPALINLPPLLSQLPLLGYVKCTPLPQAYGEARIGVAGGTVSAGKHVLRVPAGALKRPVTITMLAPSDSINSVVFQPEGLTFERGRSPKLSLDFSNCGRPQLLNTKRIVFAADNLLSILEILSSIVDLNSTTVTAPIKHFSRYAVHY